MNVIMILARDECIGEVEYISLMGTINASLIGRSYTAKAMAYMQASGSSNGNEESKDSYICTRLHHTS